MSVEFTNKWNHFGKMPEKSEKKESTDDCILGDTGMNNYMAAISAVPGEDSGEYLMRHFAVFLKMRRNKKYGIVDDVPKDYKYECVMADMSGYGMSLSVERSIREIENEFEKSQKTYRRSRSMKNLAKVCALVLLVVGVSFNSVVPHAEAFRWKLYDVFFQDKGGNSDVIILDNGRLSDDEADEETMRNEQAVSEALMKEKEGQILYPTALPGRYQVKNINKQSDGFILSLWLEGSSEDDFVLLDYNFNNKIHFNTDTEHTDLHNILVNNNDGVMIETRYRYKLVWVENGTSRFMTFAKEFFEYDETIKIAESIEWVDEAKFE